MQARIVSGAKKRSNTWLGSAGIVSVEPIFIVTTWEDVMSYRKDTKTRRPQVSTDGGMTGPGRRTALQSLKCQGDRRDQGKLGGLASPSRHGGSLRAPGSSRRSTILRKGRSLGTLADALATWLAGGAQ